VFFQIYNTWANGIIFFLDPHNNNYKAGTVKWQNGWNKYENILLEKVQSGTSMKTDRSFCLCHDHSMSSVKSTITLDARYSSHLTLNWPVNRCLSLTIYLWTISKSNQKILSNSFEISLLTLSLLHSSLDLRPPLCYILSLRIFQGCQIHFFCP